MVPQARVTLSGRARCVWLAAALVLCALGPGCWRDVRPEPEPETPAQAQQVLPNTGEAPPRVGPPEETPGAQEGEGAPEAEAGEGGPEETVQEDEPQAAAETAAKEAAATAEGETTGEEEEEEPAFTLARLKEIEEGMNYGDVVEKAGLPGLTVVTKGADTTVYKWNKEGVSFLARFNEGRLVREAIVEMPDAMKDVE